MVLQAPCHRCSIELGYWALLIHGHTCPSACNQMSHSYGALGTRWNPVRCCDYTEKTSPWSKKQNKQKKKNSVSTVSSFFDMILLNIHGRQKGRKRQRVGWRKKNNRKTSVKKVLQKLMTTWGCFHCQRVRTWKRNVRLEWGALSLVVMLWKESGTRHFASRSNSVKLKI